MEVESPYSGRITLPESESDTLSDRYLSRPL